jgi:hypothetical protein
MARVLELVDDDLPRQRAFHLRAFAGLWSARISLTLSIRV